MSSPARASLPVVRPAATARTGALPSRRPYPPRRAVRQPLRLVPARTVSAPRTPFVLLVLSLLGAGLVVLLLLNAAAVANSDQQRRLRSDTAALKIREQQLRRSVSSLEAPEALADRARKLGMVPSGDPAFLVLLPDGSSRIAGDPQPAQAPSLPDSQGTQDSHGAQGAASGSPAAGAPEPTGAAGMGDR